MSLRGQIAAVAKHRPLSSPSPGGKAWASKEDAPIGRVLGESEELDVAGGAGVAVGGDTEVGGGTAATVDVRGLRFLSSTPTGHVSTIAINLPVLGS